MEKLAKNKIREIAADVFGRYPHANSVAVTADGQAFITDDGNAAVRNHARVNRYKELLEITTFNRPEFAGKPENDSPKVASASKTVKPAAKKAEVKKAPPAKKAVKAENPPTDPAAGQNESEQLKKEE